MSERVEKFTPGPWRRYNGPLMRSIWSDRNRGKDESAVAQICGPRQYDEESDANAHLIAAAPDLYEALEGILDEVSPENISRALSALAKAIGSARAGGGE